MNTYGLDPEYWLTSLSTTSPKKEPTMRTMRQSRIDLATPVENRVREARDAVERMTTADVRLTKASELIGQALDLLGEFFDEQIRNADGK